MLIPLGILDYPVSAAVASDYDLLETEILTGTQASVTFSSLNSTYGADYQHLQLRAVIRTNRAGQRNSQSAIRFNSDTGANYAGHWLRGTGSAVESYALTSQSSITLSDGTSSSISDTDSFSALVLDILDPFETTKYTTTRHLFGNAATVYYGSGDIRLESGQWRNTAALTDITFLDINATNYAIGSRFSLYGLKAA